MDNLWVYHQLRLDKESSKVTAIITPWGVYVASLRAPLEFQLTGKYQTRMGHKVLKEFYHHGAVVYIDNTVVYGKDDNVSCKC